MAMSLEQSLKETIIECLKHQLQEFDLLKSMYPKDEDIVLKNSKILDEIHNFLQKKSDYTPNNLEYSLNLLVDGLKLEIRVNLSSFYPTELPDIYVQCNQLNGQQETTLNAELIDSIKSTFSGDVCVYTAIAWLLENAGGYAKITTRMNNTPSEEEQSPTDDKFARQWIYSHHIFSKKKREEILKLSKDLKLTGFSLPGKPGIICIEGLLSECKEWWRNIKIMSWKKIMIRKSDEFELSERGQQQKFKKFEELHFQNSSSKHNKHADMSEFSKFMEEHGLSHVFNELFGLGGDI